MLITCQSPQDQARREAGGKGYNLYLMTRAGLPVPPWIILGAAVFRSFCDLTGIGPKLRSCLAQPADPTTAAATISRLITEGPLPAPVERQIAAARAALPTTPLAVRSSALGEDGTDHSFAGQLSSFLYVETNAALITSVRACWASAFSARSLAYRQQRGIDLGAGIEVALILQQMVDAEQSGVLFTCDPVRHDDTRVTVNAVLGLGEGLVSGLLDADHFVLDKETGALVGQQLAAKPRQLVRRAGGGTVEVPVPHPQIAPACLSADQLAQLACLGRRVEGYYRAPQDLEWCFAGGQLFLLQARPVTGLLNRSEGLFQVWDNANIVESYGGITLPLTFTFARFVYHQVYVQFCEILLVPRPQLRRMDRFLRNMLGSFSGRIYYNMLNWYRLTSILPLFRQNRGFMETMMGTRHRLADDLAEQCGNPGNYPLLTAQLRRLLTGLKFLYYHFTIQGMVDRFLAYFHRVYDEFHHRDYRRLPADEIMADYHQLEERLLWRWQAPIVNDYLCMIHYGLLKRLTERWLGHLGGSLQNDLLCGEGSLESAEPTRQLVRMAAAVSRNPELRRLLEQTPDQDCPKAIDQPAFADFCAELESYIDRYGFRCMNEMKLEQQDLHQDPSFLFACLKNYLRSGQLELSAYDRRERQLRERAEQQVREALGSLRGAVYAWALKHARRAVRNREHTRFCRTRIYGVVRAMFHGMGSDYHRRGLIDAPADIFYLTLDELHGTIDGSLTVQNLRAQISLRKAEYAGYRDREPAPRFTTCGPVYWSNDLFPPEEGTPSPSLSTSTITGTGCCPGVVEGPVKVLLAPEDGLELKGEILVALRTDPGWIPLYPSVSGLLVERGGLLSHSAIVAREMGLPTIVGIRGLTQWLKTGMRVRMDGKTGTVELLD